MAKKLISIPYIYPLCPLNFSHAKMFVVADILCRFLESKKHKVVFPIASHYSGNTAQHSSDSILKVLNNKGSQDDKKIYKLHKHTYKTPNYIIETFSNSNNLLNYYTQEIYWELKSLNTSSDFKHAYSTNHKDFPLFVNEVLTSYQEMGLLIKNDANDLALNYDDKKWKRLTKKLIENTLFNENFHKKNVLSAMKNIRNDWGFLRTTGFGVKYKKKWIIDPMFDSELFTIFDLYIILKKDFKSKITNKKLFFKRLLKHLKTGSKSKDLLINAIASHLPCSVFVCEEHIKNWVVKKFYAEQKLLHPKYRTKKYIFMGMGLLDNKRMSASKGHAILSKDLIGQHGSTVARLILILSGGNIAKTCNYDKNLPKTASTMIKRFTPYFIQLVTTSTTNKKSSQSLLSEIKTHSQKLDKLIESGYHRQVAIEILTNIPKVYLKKQKQTMDVLNFYKKYLTIILPGFMEKFIS